MTTAAVPSYTGVRADTKERAHSFRSWLASVPTLVVIGSVLFAVLTVGGGLLLWGSNFANNMVHDQLASQHIVFPPKGSPALSPSEFPGLQQYAGQTVDSGPKAKAYANQFINTHLQGIGGGKTYSELSAKSLQNPKDTKLAQTVQTMFRGETLRGLLLYAWGWSVVGMIAYWVGIASLIGAFVLLLGLAMGYMVHRRHMQAEAAAS
jgi:hypothetical protein